MSHGVSGPFNRSRLKLYDKNVALVPEAAPEKAALFRGGWLRVFILVAVLLGGFFGVFYFGQPHSAPVEASAKGRKIDPSATPTLQTGPPQAAESTYLQLSAVRRPSAERLANDLRKKNFSAVLSEIDGKPGMFRVFVGPVSDTEVAQLRADLERAGFHGNAAIRRTEAETNPPKPDTAIPSSVQITKEEASGRPVAGQVYMELRAASRESAQLLVDALHQKRMNAMASEIIETPGVFRVLVGPVEDTGAGIAQLRADLQSAGFAGNAALRRTLAESDPANSGAAKADENDRRAASQAYLEFPATSRQAAEIIADALHEKGFEAVASETEDSTGGFHVLIKPGNHTSIDQLRADLERAGFHGNTALWRIAK